MTGKLKKLKQAKKLGGNGSTHKEKRKNARNPIKMASKSTLMVNIRRNQSKITKSKIKRTTTKEPRRNNITNLQSRSNRVETLKKQNLDDEKEILALEKSLRIKPDKPTLAVFYSEGVGDIIDLCNSIIKDPVTTGKSYDSLSNDHNEIEYKSIESNDASRVIASSDDSESNDEQFYNKIKQISCDLLEDSDNNTDTTNYGPDFEITSLSSMDYKKLETENDELDSICDDNCSDYNELDDDKNGSQNEISTDDCIDIEMEINKKEDNPKEINNKNIYGDGSISIGEKALKRLEEMEDSQERKDVLNRLAKQFTSILNRVSESNYMSCLNQLENIFQSNSTNDCCAKLSEGIINFCVQSKLTPDSILLAMTMIVQTLCYKIGPEVVATLLQKLCQIFENNFIEANGDDMKYLHNCVILFTLIYRFDIIEIQLIDDIITKLVERCLEQDIEMMLICLKYCGLYLKKENITILKKWISNINEKAEQNKEWLMTSRVSYMLQTINILVSNKTKKECFQEFNNELLLNFLKLSKNLIKTYKGSLNTPHKINFTYSQLLNTDPSGKWWLVGSSFTSGSIENIPSNTVTNKHNSHSKWDNKLIQLSKQHRMNTKLKQNVFCNLMTSNGVQDAFIRLIKLNLNGKETGDIAQVVVYCCLQENNFNMFYPKLISEFSKHHRTFKTSFQFALWDKIRTINENSSSTFLRNLNTLLIQLLLNESITLKVLKIVTFEDISISQQHFFKHLFSELLQFPIGSQKNIFGIFAISTKFKELSNGIKYFLLRHVAIAPNNLTTIDFSHKHISDKIRIACNFMDGSQSSIVDF